MKRFCLILAVFIPILLCAQPPKFEWAEYWGDKGNDQAFSTTADDQGNTYTVGAFTDKVDFDPGSGKTERTSAGTYDVFLSKFNSDGKFIWVKTFGSKDFDAPKSIMMDANGDLVISGSFIGTCDFDPGSGQTTLKSNGSRDVYISKFDTSGKFLWAASWGGAYTDVDSKVASDKDGNLYVAMGFNGRVDFDPGSGTTYLTASTTYRDAVVIKLDSKGQFKWVQRITGSKHENIASIDLDDDKNMYMTGTFSGTADFDPGSGKVSHTAVASYDMFILKLDSNGQYEWSGNTGSSSSVAGVEVKTAGKDVIITGQYSGTVDFDLGSGTSTLKAAGQGDIFVAKYTKSGNLSWVRTLSGSNHEFPVAMSRDKDGSLYLHGGFQGTVDFNPGLGKSELKATGKNRNAFIVKLDKAGDFEWVKQLGGSGSVSPNDIFVNSRKSVHVCGGFSSKVDFNPDTGVLQYDGDYTDPYLLKISQCYETKSTLSPIVCGSYKSPSGKYTWQKSGTYRDTLQNAEGCDSVVTIRLTVHQPSTSQLTIASCTDYTTPSGKIIYQSGIVSDTINNFKGCDSIMSINVTINQPSSSTLQVNSCNAYTSPSGKTWTASGVYSDTVLNQAGCDSIITVQLSVNSPTFSQIVTQACGQYISPSGKTWTTSGVYNDTVVNQAGCDSIITIQLSVNSPTFSQIVTQACGQYTSPSGKIWTSTAVYQDTIVNSAGCDSVITVDLKVSYAQTSTIMDTFCGAYNSPSGKYQWSASGSYMDTLVTKNGCDSVITIQLVIEALDLSVSAIDDSLRAHALNATYQWLDCNNNYAPILNANTQAFVPETHGSYAVQISKYACQDTSDCFDVIADHVLALPANFNFVVYPNPTTGDVRVKFENVSGSAEIDVFNSTGRKVLKVNSLFGDDVQFTLDGHPGIYFVVVTTPTSSKSAYVVKNR